jgi:hypothetical protein
MKKILMILSVLMIVLVACKEQPKPEELEKTPTMEEALKQAQDPNDFTQNPLVGELVSMDLAAQGNNNPLSDVATANKMVKDGAFIVFKAGEAYYVVLNKNDYTYNVEPLAQLAGKKIALYGMVKNVSGVNFFLMEKAEEAK